MGKARVQIAIALAALSACAIGTFGYRAYIYDKLNSQGAEGFEDYKHGRLKVLPGPYLPEGNSSELKFKPVDLGNGWIRSVSEKGDLLMASYGEKPAIVISDGDAKGYHKETPSKIGRVEKVLRSDGSVEILQSCLDSQMSASGQVFRIVGNRDSAYKIWSGAKLVFNSEAGFTNHPESLANWRVFGEPAGHVTDDGIFASSDNTDVFSTSGSKALFVDRIMKTDHGVHQSSSLGTILIQRQFSKTDPDHAAKLVCIRSGSVKTYDFPSRVWSPQIATGRDRLVFRDENDWRTKLWQFKDEKFSELPIPSGIVTVWVDAVNSRGDMVLIVNRLDANRASKDYPYKGSRIFVSSGKAYELSQILAGVGLSSEIANANGPATALDENGDLFLNLTHEGQPKVVQLKRI